MFTLLLIAGSSIAIFNLFFAQVGGRLSSYESIKLRNAAVTAARRAKSNR